MSRLKKGDQVIVRAGNHKGATGDIIRVKEDRVIVQGVNTRKKHIRPAQGRPGSIANIEMPIHISNVALAVDGKPVKLRSRTDANGSRELYYMQNGQPVVYRSLKQSKEK